MTIKHSNEHRTKSGKNRSIPMTAELHSVLSMLPSRVKKGYVFIDPSTGEKFTPERLMYLWDTKVRHQAGFESDCRFHYLRHSFASQMVMNGINLPTVKDLMGHVDITQTMQYSHLAPDQIEKAIKTLENALKKDAVQMA